MNASFEPSGDHAMGLTPRAPPKTPPFKSGEAARLRRSAGA